VSFRKWIDQAAFPPSPTLEPIWMPALFASFAATVLKDKFPWSPSFVCRPLLSSTTATWFLNNPDSRFFSPLRFHLIPCFFEISKKPSISMLCEEKPPLPPRTFPPTRNENLSDFSNVADRRESFQRFFLFPLCPLPLPRRVPSSYAFKLVLFPTNGPLLTRLSPHTLLTP